MTAVPGRRRFLLRSALLGGGLLLGYALGRPRDLLGERARLPPTADAVALNGWIRVGTDGTVTVAVPRAEMGQGVHTALAMLVAEEMGADWAQISVEPAPIDPLYVNLVAWTDLVPYDEAREDVLGATLRWAYARAGRTLGIQLTGGSTSVRDAWLPMRTAGAAARWMLRAAAAARWGVAPAAVSVEAGQVRHVESARRAGFGELAAAAARETPPRDLPLRAPSTYRLIGHAAPRLDLPAKIAGEPVFGIDVHAPDMLFAAVRAAPVFGARLAEVDAGTLARSAGVIGVVRLPTAVAVVARTTWHAQRALEAAAPVFAPATTSESLPAIFRRFERALTAGDAFTYDRRGVLPIPLAAPTLTATYRAPLLAHACLEPPNCTVRIGKDEADIWCGTQAPDLLQRHAAAALDLPRARIRIHQHHLGGGFGRRAEPDVMLQALAIAREYPGRLLKLVWSRGEDLQHDVYRAPAMAQLSARLDGGTVTHWHHRGASPDLSPRFMGRLYPEVPVFGPDRLSVDGAAYLAYDFANLQVDHVAVPVDPLPIGIWRSVGHSTNVFFVESFVDELAHASGRDAFDFRLAHLAHPRARALLIALRTRSGWDDAPPPGVARGLAFCRAYGSLIAVVAEVTRDADAIRVRRFCCAVDCGIVINPDTVRAQIEGGLLFGLSAALWGEAPYVDGRIDLHNFDDYRLLTLAETPDIEVLLIPSAAPPGGIGELATPVVAPAVANALATLTGMRSRELPLQPRAQRRQPVARQSLGADGRPVAPWVADSPV